MFLSTVFLLYEVQSAQLISTTVFFSVSYIITNYSSISSPSTVHPPFCLSAFFVCFRKSPSHSSALYHPSAGPFVYTLSDYVALSLSYKVRHWQLSLSPPLSRKQCTGMGAKGVEWGNIAFKRCQELSITYTHLQTHTYTNTKIKRMLAGQWIGLRSVSMERGPCIPPFTFPTLYSLTCA